MSDQHTWVGRIVNVYFAQPRLDLYGATVLYQPVATGDAWLLRTREGLEVRVMEFQRMDEVR